MPSESSETNANCPCAHRFWLGVGVLSAVLLAGMPSTKLAAQNLPATPAAAQAGPSSFQGSVTSGEASPGAIDLTLDEAIQRGLKNNLGVILSGTQTASARGQRLSQLQSLLPTVDGTIKEAEMQVDLAAQGLRIPGFPTIVGPFGFTDIRASMDWSLVNVNSLRAYLAAKHNFTAAQLTAQDARDLVVLTVGNAYLLVIADESRVTSVQAQVGTSKVSLDQAVQSHQAGTRSEERRVGKECRPGGGL